MMKKISIEEVGMLTDYAVTITFRNRGLLENLKYLLFDKDDKTKAAVLNNIPEYEVYEILKSMKAIKIVSAEDLKIANELLFNEIAMCEATGEIEINFDKTKPINIKEFKELEKKDMVLSESSHQSEMDELFTYLYKCSTEARRNGVLYLENELMERTELDYFRNDLLDFGLKSIIKNSSNVIESIDDFEKVLIKRMKEKFDLIKMGMKSITTGDSPRVMSAILKSKYKLNNLNKE